MKQRSRSLAVILSLLFIGSVTGVHGQGAGNMLSFSTTSNCGVGKKENLPVTGNLDLVGDLTLESWVKLPTAQSNN